MLPELNKFYLNKNLSVRKCIHVAEKKNNPYYIHHTFIDSRNSKSYVVETKDFEKNFHELAFQCDINDPIVHESYRNHQFITELFELIIDKNSDYNVSSNNIKLNQSRDFEYVDLSHNDHKYIAKCSKDIAIIENIRQNKAKTLYNKIMALQNSGLLK